MKNHETKSNLCRKMNCIYTYTIHIEIYLVNMYILLYMVKYTKFPNVQGCLRTWCPRDHNIGKPQKSYSS